ncbi:SigB/SigF/SigG family RNA polymerase sigma factor [Aneurinibacillus aneurinilyticus]|uniref:SigB/SigF/SigG family RNA polymerase sigma factor n=1 Tax=Aneurinibacillus aneurinilyticus TaxID=1391 RepID=UPI0023F52A6B|nr:SigB/SigF/SigG family RNA polymerase sigma factor [Aneurinibacillus aneurinilyticus]MCI1693810.1 SigB/SigF/SigG family RNA polymerase sigma factor [Aneurinibacillus aneurinilyticus]
MSQTSTRKSLNRDITEYIRMYQETGSEELVEQILENYQTTVKKLASKMARDFHLVDDLYQVGMLALLGAIDKFDSEVSHNFDAYAVSTIVGKMKHYLRDKTWSIRVPRTIKEMGYRLQKTIDELTVELQRSPRIDEIADKLEVSEEKVLEIMENKGNIHALSLDSPMKADNQEQDSHTLMDMIPDQDPGFLDVDRKMDLSSLLEDLDEQQRQVIHYVYYEEWSQRQIGEKLGISQMQVSRILRKTLQQMRDAYVKNSE